MGEARERILVDRLDADRVLFALRGGVHEQLRSRVAKADVWRRVEDSNAFLDERQVAQVVRGRPLEILATRVSDDKRIVVVHTDVDGIAEDANTVITPGVVLCDLEGSVGRGIVTDHELEVAKCLPEDRFDGLPEP